MKVLGYANRAHPKFKALDKSIVTRVEVSTTGEGGHVKIEVTRRIGVIDNRWHSPVNEKYEHEKFSAESAERLVTTLKDYNFTPGIEFSRYGLVIEWKE